MWEIIANKTQSKNRIASLDLNRVPEIMIDKGDTESIVEFFSKYAENLYIVRDAERSSSKYFYVSSVEECVQKAKTFSGKVIVAVSINTYKNKILLGAIEIDGELVRICATTNEKYDHRTMYNGDAEFDLQTDIFDKKLALIPHFDFLYSYIVNNGLTGCTVEFTIYDRPVGIKKENIIVNEIRNY